MQHVSVIVLLLLLLNQFTRFMHPRKTVLVSQWRRTHYQYEEEKQAAATSQTGTFHFLGHATSAPKPDMALEDRVAFAYRFEPFARANFLAMKPQCPLYPHQISGAQFMLQRMRGQLAPPEIRGGGYLDDMRTGKTRGTLFAAVSFIQEEVAQGKERFGLPVLIVTNKDIMGTWKAELEAMYGSGALSLLMLETENAHEHSNQQRLLVRLREQTDIVITSSSFLTSSGHFAADLLRQAMAYRIILCDEAHEYLSPGTQAQEVLCALKAHARWYVSGTPIQNSLRSLQTALEFMGATRAQLSDDRALVELARRLAIRRTWNHKEVIPRTMVAYDRPLEERLYGHIVSQLFADLDGRQGRDRSMTQLRLINTARQFVLSPYMCQSLFESGELVLPATGRDACLLAPAELIGTLPPKTNSTSAPTLTPNTKRKLLQRTQGNKATKTPSGINFLPEIGDLSAHLSTSFGTSTASSESLVMILAIREMTFQALAIADPDRSLAWGPELLEMLRERPFLAAELNHKVVAMKAKLVPLVSLKERRVCNELLGQRTDPAREKIIIFSNLRLPLQRLAKLLDLRLKYQVPGARHYAYVDGHDDMERRTRERHRFATDPDCGVMLATIDVSSRGLDLTHANHVVLYDPWWNPSVEHQAINRIRGPRQTRQTHVYRLITPVTVEEYIADVGDRKVNLDKKTLPSTLLGREDEPREDQVVDMQTGTETQMSDAPHVERENIHTVIQRMRQSLMDMSY
jgi:SNF2 family DNA or RNA helicase